MLEMGVAAIFMQIVLHFPCCWQPVSISETDGVET